MRTVDIPPLCQLGTFPVFSDWTIAYRCWTTGRVKHYQFVVRHPNGWLFEYRCLGNGQCLDFYWCSAPESKIRWLGEIISALLHIEFWRHIPLNVDG